MPDRHLVVRIFYIFGKITTSMKSIVCLALVLNILAGCTTSGSKKTSENTAPDISDLSVNPEFQKSLAARRAILLGKIEKGIIIVRSDYGFDGGRHAYRASDNFFYLAGMNQPGAAIALKKGEPSETILLLKNRTIRETIYDGEVPSPDYLSRTYLLDSVLPYDELDKIISGTLMAGLPVYTDFNDTYIRTKILDDLKKEKAPESLLKDIAPEIHELRIFKDDTEIERIRKAVNITKEALVNAFRMSRPGLYEFETEAVIEGTFLRNGASMPAFESIVGSGPNSVTLHYGANNRMMEDGDLLLMDIGAEYGNYCADITRTIPVNGKFSKEQKDIYQLVLKAQKAAISAMKPGNQLIEGQNRYRETVIQGLFELGLLTDPESDWQKKFYIIHGTSHYLGLNVHDVGSYGAPDSAFSRNAATTSSGSRMLEKGMVLTVEPGIYLRSNGLSQLNEMYSREASEDEIREFIEKVGPVYEKYRNIGVRIEDDVLITETGCVVLSENIPKEVDEIESIMRKK